MPAWHGARGNNRGRGQRVERRTGRRSGKIFALRVLWVQGRGQAHRRSRCEAGRRKGLGEREAGWARCAGCTGAKGGNEVPRLHRRPLNAASPGCQHRAWRAGGTIQMTGHRAQGTGQIRSDPRSLVESWGTGRTRGARRQGVETCCFRARCLAGFCLPRVCLEAWQAPTLTTMGVGHACQWGGAEGRAGPHCRGLHAGRAGPHCRGLHAGRAGPLCRGLHAGRAGPLCRGLHAGQRPQRGSLRSNKPAPSVKFGTPRAACPGSFRGAAAAAAQHPRHNQPCTHPLPHTRPNWYWSQDGRHFLRTTHHRLQSIEVLHSHPPMAAHRHQMHATGGAHTSPG